MAINIAEELVKAGTKYKKELLSAPVWVLKNELKNRGFNLRPGIQGKVVGGLLTVSAGLRPYKTDKGATGAITVEPYEWETFLGDEVKEFDPHAILGTLYTELTSKGVKEYEFVKRVALEVAKSVGDSLYSNLYSATRNAAGTTTADLFNGWDSLVAAAIVAGTMSETKGNYQDISSTPMTMDNCGDLLKKAWRNLDPHLKKQKCRLRIPVSITEMYQDWYEQEHNVELKWNDTGAQRILHGSFGKCILDPSFNMEGGDYLHFSVDKNMNVGFDQESDSEEVRIRECDNPKLVQFFMKAYFGAGFETIQQEFMTSIKYSTAEENPA